MARDAGRTYLSGKRHSATPKRYEPDYASQGRCKKTCTTRNLLQKKEKLFLRTPYLWNYWLRCLPPTIYKDLLSKLFNPCLTQSPPETHTPTTANLSTLFQDQQSLQQKAGLISMNQHTNPPNSPIHTPKTLLLSYMHTSITQAAPH